MFKIEIHTDGAAFHAPEGEPDDGLETVYETAAILNRVIEALMMDGLTVGTLRDTNGNTVGSFSLT